MKRERERERECDCIFALLRLVERLLKCLPFVKTYMSSLRRDVLVRLKGVYILVLFSLICCILRDYG